NSFNTAGILHGNIYFDCLDIPSYHLTIAHVSCSGEFSSLNDIRPTMVPLPRIAHGFRSFHYFTNHEHGHFAAPDEVIAWT
ncbi:MAG TPA: hypothetical protein PLI32_08120, partial [Deltaproteobacteria bacterium]|nr:hypothetical protein [Deltaproteobacteria bacterium]